MTVKLANARQRLGQLAATRASLPAIVMLPVRAEADVLLSRHYTDGVTREISEALGRIPDLLVIDPSTALQIRSPHVNPRQLKAELGVDYVLLSNVECDDQNLNFTQQLFDAQLGELIWEETVEAWLGQLYEFEKRVVARVVNSMLPRLREAEIERTFRKSTSSLTAYELTMQALGALERLTPQSLDRADALLARARAEDSTYATAFAWSARARSIRVGQDWTGAEGRVATANQAMAFAKTAIELDSENSLALATAGHLHSYLRREYDTGLGFLERSLTASMNDALAWSLSSATLTYLGRAKEARVRAEHAIWLSPLDRNIYQFSFFAGLASYVLGDYDRSISWLRMSMAENPAYTATVKTLIAALVGADDVKQARELRPVLQRLEPSFGAGGTITCPLNDPVAKALYITQMRTAGY